MKLVKIALFLVSFLVQGTVNAQLKGDSFVEAKAKGNAKVVYTYVETPGFVAKDGAEVKGFCVDLMAAFAKWLKKEEGIVLEHSFNDKNSRNFPLLMNELKNSKGGVFGLGTFTITEERKATYDFSPPFINNVTIIMTNNKLKDLSSLENISTEFKGMTMVTVKGSLHEKRLLGIKKDYFPGVGLKYVASFDDVLQELEDNEKAFTELDFTYYLASLRNKTAVKRHPVGDAISGNFGIIISKNSDWEPVMARFLTTEFKNSLEYRKMVVDHLGQHALKLLDAMSVN